jgi:hypothetical protein
VSLRKKPIPVVFQGGVDTKTDSKAVLPVKLLDLQNAVFTKQTSLAKRNGYRALGRSVDGMSGTYGNPRGLGALGRELLLFDDKHCYSQRPSSNSWALAGDVAVASATDEPIARTGTAQTQPDIATRHGITLVAWEDNRGGVWCSVIEDATGRALVNQKQLDAGGSIPRCVPVGEVLHVIWANGQRLWLAICNPAVPEAALVPRILTEDLDPAYPTFDAEPTLAAFSGDRPAVIAWSIAGGYRVGYLVAPGVLGSPLTGTPSVGTNLVGTMAAGLSVTFDRSGASGIWVGVALLVGFGNTDVFWNAHSIAAPNTVARSVLVDFAAIPVARLAAEIVGGALWWAAERWTLATQSTDTQQLHSGAFAVATGVTITSAQTLHGHSLSSRAFVDASDVYVCITNGARFSPYVAVVRLSAATFGGAGTTCVARLLPGESTGMLLRNHLPSVVAQDIADTDIASREHGLILGYRIQLDSANNDQFGEEGFRYVSLDLGSESYRSVPLGRGLYLAGAMPLHYDGARWAEADFHAAPDFGFAFTLALVAGVPPLYSLTPVVPGAAFVVQAAGGGLNATQTYLYAYVYEEIDAQGELHPSGVSVSVEVVLTGGNQQTILGIPMLRLTGKRRVRIGVFRTLGNETGEPSQLEFFRVSSTDPNVSGTNGYVLNDPTTDFATFNDAMTDANCALKEPLYTNGGILSDDPTTLAGGVIAGGKSRLFFTVPDDPNLVGFSQQLRDDTATEFAPSLTMRIDPLGGAITGIGIMDDAVIVFRETAIHAFVGPGPDADGDLSGSTDAFSPPQLITSDVGCISPGSICQSPVGIVFQSAKGIMLLGRDRQVQRIGNDVYAYNGQTITRAVLLPDRTQVVFLTADPTGRTLMWDYDPQRNQWSTYTNHLGLDGVVVDGSFYYLRTDGRVFVETPGEYADDNSHIPMRIDTAFIKAAGYLQGWQKILVAQFLGTYKSSHTLNISYRIDYQDAWSAADPLAVDANYAPELYGAGLYGAGAYGGAGGPNTVYQESLHLNLRCQSIAFRIEDVEPTGKFGASFELSEMLLVGGVLGARFFPGAARQG